MANSKEPDLLLVENLAKMIVKQTGVAIIRLYLKDFVWYAQTPAGERTLSEILQNR